MWDYKMKCSISTNDASSQAGIFKKDLELYIYHSVGRWTLKYIYTSIKSSKKHPTVPRLNGSYSIEERWENASVKKKNAGHVCYFP